MSVDKAHRIGKCPFKFVPLDNNDDIKNLFLGYEEKGLVRSVPENWTLGGGYEEDGHADAIYNFNLREDDVWVVTYPKSGTSWTQHIVWLMLNNLDFDNPVRADMRSPFLDLDQCTPISKFTRELEVLEAKYCHSVTKEDQTFLEIVRTELAFNRGNRVQDAEAIPVSEQRLIKSHLPFSLLPPDLLQRNKVIYVARDPRDVCVSYYHHHRLIRHHEFIGDFDRFVQFFVDEQVLWSPYWQHIHQAWQLRNHPNLLFIFFSDMKRDLRSVLVQIATFLGKSFSEDELQQLLEHLKIDKMRQNEAVNDTDIMVKLGIFKKDEGSFIRSGKTGGWRDYFNESSTKKLQLWQEKAQEEYPDLPWDRLWS